MSKKKILTLALCVAMAAILAVGTLAYFTDTEEANNVFTVGNVNIELTEPHWDGDDGTGEKDAPEVYPGEALAKDPQVKNIGENPCFVRVKVEGLDCLESAGAITFETNNVSGALGDGWVDGGDGYYYYMKPLAGPYQAEHENPPFNSDTTTALFDHIRMPKGLTNGDAEIEYSVDVTAEAVQAQGAKSSWSLVKAMTVEEIAAWFTTCGM